jgi:hypothetical protein
MLNGRALSLGILVACVIGLAPRAQAQQYEPPAASRNLLRGIDFAHAAPVDEDYRAEFKRCDDQDVFRGQKLQGWRKCSPDKNNVKALLKLSNGAILYESKLSLDLDGSWKAWNTPGAADQRGTWYTWPRVCKPRERDTQGLCQREQVDAEHVPFIVIPIAGPKALRGEFRAKTGVDKGDFGVVVFGNHWVPAFVADGGPYNKLGESSAATLAALGEDRCTHHNDQGFCDRYRDASISSGVVTIIFPGSRRAGLKPDSAMKTMCDTAKTMLGLTGSPLCSP